MECASQGCKAAEVPTGKQFIANIEQKEHSTARSLQNKACI